MNTENGVTRRMLLSVGGMVLLGGCTSQVTHQVKATGDTTRLPRPRPQPPRLVRPVSTTVPTQPGQVGHGSNRVGADRPVFYLDDGAKSIALTIDDGPNPIYTPQVLKVLQKYRVTAAFSMIGLDVTQYPGVARDVAAAGHMICNHTWSHPDLALLPPVAVVDQMNRATDAIHKAVDQVPTVFRAPYGVWSRAVLAQCVKTGMLPLAWSVDPRDWARPGVYSIVDNIIRNTRTGSIILEHDGGGDRAQTVAALNLVIPRLLEAGYHFRTP